MLGIKQDALACDLGDDWNHKKISLLEQKETIDILLLQQISAALKIPIEVIQNFDEEPSVNIIYNTLNTHAQSSGVSVCAITNMNLIEKRETLEEIKRLNAEFLKVKDGQIQLLQGLVEKK